MAGLGILYCADDKVFKGLWQNNQLNGYGEFHSPDGSKYIGYYKDNKKEGFGIYYWEDQQKLYIGFWKNGFQHGPGIIVNKNLKKYGHWELGVRTKWYNRLEDMILTFSGDKTKYKHYFSHNFKQLLKLLD